jgi:hypothetical protein
MEELERRVEHPSSEARPLRGGPSPLGAGPGEVPAILLAPIHRSAWKDNSANFAQTGFSEVSPNVSR